MDFLHSYLVSADNIKKKVDFGDLFFETTEDLYSNETIIGQDRAVKAMEFGLQIKQEGYNIFLTGLNGTGKTSYAKLSLETVSKNEETPGDICFVYNFNEANTPLWIEFEAGKGKEFKKDMNTLIKKLKVEIPEFFSTENYKIKQKKITDDYKKNKNKFIKELKDYAKKNSYKLKSTEYGYITIPMINGQEITNDKYEALDANIRQEIEVKSEKIQLKALEVLKKIEQNEKNTEEKTNILQEKTSFSLIRYFICCLETKYSDNKKVQSYLKDLEKDLMENISIFLPEDDEFELAEDELLNEIENLKQIYKENEKTLLFKRYKINLFIDNSSLKGAPIIFELNPTFQNLLGKLEYENNRGALTTNFMNIIPGAVHKARGGYLVLQVQDVLANPFVWEGLKRTLKSNKTYIEDLKEQVGLVVISNLNPQPIDTNIKIILLGTPYLYNLLFEKDEDFKKLFKIKVAFDYEMENNEKNINKMAYFISSHCKKEGLKHFDRQAVIKTIEYSKRLAGSQEKLTTLFNELLEIIYEADTFAKIDNSPYVLDRHVGEAIKEKKYRHNLYEDKIYEEIEKDKILLSVEGYKIGQINGLAVLNTGDYLIGKPNKITATTFMGRRGVINIERETNLSGDIHDKGLMILKGYLGEQFSQNYPLTLSAKICFEQLYNTVDGDSASSTELYALLSSLANIPINQSIAATGSINQKGEIQSVGGITEKIEGFYNVCKRKGFTGDQGVVIPRKNIPNLVLNDEIMEDIEKKFFSIYAIETVEEGIEILMNLKAGKKNENGEFPENTLYYKIQTRLAKNREEALRLNKSRI